MSQSNKQTEVTLTSAELNQALRDAGLWKPGCQFLSNAEKETLLTGTKGQQQTIYDKLSKKQTNINSKLSELNRASFEVDSSGKIHLDYKESKDTELVKSDSLKELKKFQRPIEVTPVFYGTGKDKAHQWNAIVRQDDNYLINIVKSSYQVISNTEVIAPLMEKMSLLDNKWYIDKSHSFVTPEKMRLQLTFPELIVKDGESDMPLCLFVHNSYDSSEKVRIMWGMQRLICSNGLTIGQVLGEYSGKHTKYFDVHSLQREMDNVINSMDTIQKRVEQLQNEKMTRAVRSKIKVIFGERIAAYIDAVVQQQGLKAIETQWQLYNVITYYISHAIQMKLRSHYQHKASAFFKL